MQQYEDFEHTKYTEIPHGQPLLFQQEQFIVHSPLNKRYFSNYQLSLILAVYNINT